MKLLTMNHDLNLLKDLLNKLYIFKCNTKWLNDIYGTITIDNVKLDIEVKSSDDKELEEFDCLKAKYQLDDYHASEGVYYFFIEEDFSRSGITFVKGKERNIICSEGKWQVT
jgi:hypothetical protein